MPWNASCCPGSRMSAVPMSRSDLSNPSHEGKQKMRLIGKAAGILAVTAALATASAPSMAQTKVTISQAFQSMLYLPFYVAIDKGFFKKEGIDVDKETAGPPTAALPAVLSSEESRVGTEGVRTCRSRRAPDH